MLSESPERLQRNANKLAMVTIKEEPDIENVAKKLKEIPGSRNSRQIEQPYEFNQKHKLKPNASELLMRRKKKLEKEKQKPSNDKK